MPLPTTLPVVERIARDVLTTVKGVTTANGYSFNVTAQRHSRAGDKRAHLNAIVVQETTTEVPDPVYFTKEWTQSFSIGVFIIPPESDATPIDSYANVVRADIEKALLTDRLRGGNALDSQIRAPRIISDDGLEFDIVEINLDVGYRTVETDPYQTA